MESKFNIEKYKTTHRNRGIAIVINDSHDRKGSEKDVEAVYAVFKHLKFDVRIYEDKTVKHIRAALREIRKEDHSGNDCLVIVAMAHGTGNESFILKGETMYFTELWEGFVGNKCPSLIGKPKLVFIQSCRGEKLDMGASFLQVDAAPKSEKSVCVTIPMYADLLVMYATYTEHVAWREDQTGSWFIQCLCKVLQSSIAEIELFTLLTQVSNLVSKYTAKWNVGPAKQIPMINSMLTKAFYFVPKN